MAAHGRSGPLIREWKHSLEVRLYVIISQSFKITGFLAFIYFSYHLHVKKVNIWHNADSIPNLLYVVGIRQFNFPKKHDCSIPDFKYTCCQAAIYKNIK